MINFYIVKVTLF